MLRRFSIQSKLLIMLVLTAISAMLVIAWLGYDNGRRALTEASFSRLTSLRASRASQVEAYFNAIEREVEVFSRDLMVVEAMQDFLGAYQDLENREIPPEWDNAIRQHYTDQFIPQLALNIDSSPEAEMYIPSDRASRYLQYQYIVGPEVPEERRALDDAGDGSTFSRLHRRYHPVMRELVEKFGYLDLYLISPYTGEIVYTVQKGVDFSTSLNSGPYVQSNLARAYRSVLSGVDQDLVALVDFEPYRPRHAMPTAFMTSPIYENGILYGVLAVQISPDEINRIMTGSRSWQRDGLGDSGEVYLVGSDLRLRSVSRFRIETPEAYLVALQDAGLTDDQIERIERMDTALTVHPINTEMARSAVASNVGTRIGLDYRAVPVLSSFAPLDIPGLDWVILAEIDAAEAFAPSRDFQQLVLISTVAIILLTTLVAVALSSIFVRPVNALMEGARRIAAGETDVQISVSSSDEFGELAASFNEMAQSLREKSETIANQQHENKTLLLNILPESVAKRFHDGDTLAADDFPDITVLSAEIDGFVALSHEAGSEEAVSMLNELINAFDEAAERFGMEKISTSGATYVAVSGLAVARLGQAKRTVDFAQEMLRILQQFNRERTTALSLRIGVHKGPAVAGIVGRNRFVYDVWGHAVGVARKLDKESPPNSIRVSQTVRERLNDVYQFEPAPMLPLHGLASHNGSMNGTGASGDEVETWLVSM